MTRIPSAYPHVPSRLPRRFSTLRPQRTATSYPARLAGDPSNLHTRGRPLTFPLGSLLGFFVGFATAGIAGYTYLLHSHAALQAASRAAVADLERIVGEMEASSAELLGGTGGTTVVGELQARLSEVQAQVGVLGDQRKREREQREASRVEARVVGVEEELVEVRDTLLALERHLTSSPSSSLSSSSLSPPPPSTLAELRNQLAQIGIQPATGTSATTLRNGQVSGGLLWTGKSNARERLV